MVEFEGKIIDENDIAHYIDERIDYYSGSRYGYDDCWMFKWGALSSASAALKGLDGIKRKIGVGILKEIKKSAIDTIVVYGDQYYVVPEDVVMEIYDTYEYQEENV